MQSSAIEVKEVANCFGEKICLLTDIAVTTLYKGEFIQVGTKQDGTKFLYDIVTRIFTRFENWSISNKAKEFYDGIAKIAPLYLILCEESGLVRYIIQYNHDILTAMKKPEEFWLIEAGYYNDRIDDRVYKV